MSVILLHLPSSSFFFILPLLSHLRNEGIRKKIMIFRGNFTKKDGQVDT